MDTLVYIYICIYIYTEMRHLRFRAGPQSDKSWQCKILIRFDSEGSLKVWTDDFRFLGCVRKLVLKIRISG